MIEPEKEVKVVDPWQTDFKIKIRLYHTDQTADKIYELDLESFESLAEILEDRTNRSMGQGDE